ncbi:MAG: methionyl-tRNA formyltransferase [Clostridiales bacterium]|nr:methionyl-tRNA formyltransferase [Clostridiales bacterium]
MRIVFMGTPDFSVPVLESLLDSRHEVVAVVTQPDRPKGRGKEIQMSPVKETALARGTAVYQPARARDGEFIEKMRALAPDLMVVIAYGQILPQELLDVPRFGCINIHASLLPRYRGAAPIQWAVINGDKETGVTTMMMDAGMDTGDMLETRVVPIDEKETGGSLFDKLSFLGGELILSTIDRLEAGTLVRTPQDDGQATYVSKISKELGEIDWGRSAVEIERLIRGLNPWPSAYTHCGGKLLKLWDADVEKRADQPGQPECPEFSEPGTVLTAAGDVLRIQTGDGVLRVRTLQLEGKKRMDTAAFLRGFAIAPGTVLGKE